METEKGEAKKKQPGDNLEFDSWCLHNMSELSGTELGKYSIRIRKKIGKGKQRNSLEEMKTGNVTSGKKIRVK